MDLPSLLCGLVVVGFVDFAVVVLVVGIVAVVIVVVFVAIVSAVVEVVVVIVSVAHIWADCDPLLRGNPPKMTNFLSMIPREGNIVLGTVRCPNTDHEDPEKSALPSDPIWISNNSTAVTV